jgi:hypothetical protein
MAYVRRRVKASHECGQDKNLTLPKHLLPENQGDGLYQGVQLAEQAADGDPLTTRR